MNISIIQIALAGNVHVLLSRGENVLDAPRVSPDGHHLAYTQGMWESNALAAGELLTSDSTRIQP
jgi:hypothetical protein